ncbi:MAG: redox-regulated ATPase YchF [Thermoguttaceae bacterium]|nr:redox-regulated ATPase YchF [Thermoguttaceae bacterium]
MKVGLVGYAGSGKSSLFEWLSGATPDPSAVHSSQLATATIPEPRIEALCEIYKPKKVTYASMEIVDTPGLNRDHVGNVAKLAHLREADYLVCVVPAFDGSKVDAEMQAFVEDMILADLEIATNRVEKIEEQFKRRRSKEEQEALEIEYETLKLIRERLEAGNPLLAEEMTEEQYKATRSFRFLTEKRRMILVNTGDDETDFEQYNKFATEKEPVLAVSVGLELELSKMAPEEADAFLEEMGLTRVGRDKVVRTLMDASGQMVFLTAGDKEVRSWLTRKNSSAVEAAGKIHTDFIKKFIRCEVIACDDLIRLGSEREVKAAGLNHRETKEYVVQEGDVLLFHISQ